MRQDGIYGGSRVATGHSKDTTASPSLSLSRHRHRSRSPQYTRRPRSRSKSRSPRRQKRSRSPVYVRESRTQRIPWSDRSRSRSPIRYRRSRSRSPWNKKRSRSPFHVRGSLSPPRHRRSRSRSPVRKSKSPKRKSYSPHRHRGRLSSLSPRRSTSRHKSKSRSPKRPRAPEKRSPKPKLGFGRDPERISAKSSDLVEEQGLKPQTDAVCLNEQPEGETARTDFWAMGGSAEESQVVKNLLNEGLGIRGSEFSNITDIMLLVGSCKLCPRKSGSKWEMCETVDVRTCQWCQSRRNSGHRCVASMKTQGTLLQCPHWSEPERVAEARKFIVFVGFVGGSLSENKARTIYGLLYGKGLIEVEKVTEKLRQKAFITCRCRTQRTT